MLPTKKELVHFKPEINIVHIFEKPSTGFVYIFTFLYLFFPVLRIQTCCYEQWGIAT